MGLYGGTSSTTWRGGTVRKASTQNKANNVKKVSVSKPTKVSTKPVSKSSTYGGPNSSTWRGGTARKSSTSNVKMKKVPKAHPSTTSPSKVSKPKPASSNKAKSIASSKTKSTGSAKVKAKVTSSTSKTKASISGTIVSKSSSGASKKLKNKNYYQYIGIRKKPEWKANVTNDKDVDVPTLSFKSEFVTAANDLVTKMKTVKKDLKTVNQNLKNIKKKGGDAITTKSIDNVRVSFETSSDAFYKSCKALRDGALGTYNEWLQALYDSMAQTALTDQGTESDAQVDEVESNFE